MKKLLFLLVPFMLFASNSVTIIDSKAWQDEPYTLEEEEAYEEKRNYGKVMNLAKAKSYCSNLNLGGSSGWRLPHKDELKALQKRKAELKNSVLFHFWSYSAEHSDDDDWTVGFITGTAMWNSGKKMAYVSLFINNTLKKQKK